MGEPKAETVAAVREWMASQSGKVSAPAAIAAFIEEREKGLREEVGKLHRLLQRADALLDSEDPAQEPVWTEVHEVLVRCSDANERADRAEAELAAAREEIERLKDHVRHLKVNETETLKRHDVWRERAERLEREHPGGDRG